METTIVNIKKINLNQRGITDFKQWASIPNNLYIGRNMNFYVEGAIQSKWHNPFPVKKYGRDQCLKLYEEYIQTSNLMDDLSELIGKELGCWCKPSTCHGDVLIKLLIKSLPIGTIVSYVNLNCVTRPAGSILKFCPDYFIYETIDTKIKFRVRYLRIKSLTIF